MIVNSVKVECWFTPVYWHSTREYTPHCNIPRRSQVLVCCIAVYTPLYVFVQTCPGVQDSKEKHYRTSINSNKICMYQYIPVHTRPWFGTLLRILYTWTSQYKDVQRSIYSDAVYLAFPWYVILQYMLPSSSLYRVSKRGEISTLLRHSWSSSQYVRVCTSMYEFVQSQYSSYWYVRVCTCKYYTKKLHHGSYSHVRVCTSGAVRLNILHIAHILHILLN